MSDNHDDHAHTSTLGYILVFIALMFLSVLTWASAVFIDFHDYGFAFGNILLALIIAFTKVSLVLYFFMHLRESPKIVKLTGVTGFFFVAIMLAFFITDMTSRDGKGEEFPDGDAWPASDPAIEGPEFDVIVGPPAPAHH